MEKNSNKITNNTRDILPLEFLYSTEKSAIASYNWIGKRDSISADRDAVNAMRKSFNKINANIIIAIGEGERDNAPMLNIGEILGNKDGEPIDVAVDPLEGTEACVNNKPGAISVLAFSRRGNILSAPDIYMEKIIIGPNYPKEIVSLKNNIKDNLKNIVDYRKCKVSDLRVSIMNRPRHYDIIDDIKSAGAMISLISDGDIKASIQMLLPKNDINHSYCHDMYIGTGGAPEGVISASAVKNMKGQMECKLIFGNRENEANKFGINDINKIYKIDEIIKGPSVFVATAITEESIINRLKKDKNRFVTSSIIIDYNGCKRYKNEHHDK